MKTPNRDFVRLIGTKMAILLGGIMDYICKIEIYFRQDKTYDVDLLRRKKSDCNDKWEVCACCVTGALENVFEVIEEWSHFKEN